MTVPIRDDGGFGAAAGRAWTAPGPKPAPNQVVGNLVALEQAAAFFALPDHQLRRLARRLRPVDLRPGERVVEQGASGDSLYMILRGSCAVQVEPEPGRPVTLTRLGEGDLCGEAALRGEPSAVSVAALTDCRLLALDQASLRSVIPPGSPGEAEIQRQALQRQSSYRQLAARARRDGLSGEASVIAVYAPKGGSGRTTIALNLAAQLARGHPGDVLVMDLDFPYNPAALLSGLVPTGSLTRASWGAALGTLGDLKDELLGAAQLHPSGYLVLPGALRVEESELVTTEQVANAFRALRGAFRHIVVDLGTPLSEIALNVCDLARHIVLVLTLELPSLHGGREVLQLFRNNLHIPEGHVALVLNQRQAGPVVPRDAVERTLGRPPAVEVGHDGNRAERAALVGTVLAVSEPRSEIARGVRRLAELVGEPGGREERPR